MTDRELMQQALEALDSDNPDIQLRTAIALRDRLAQPEQEPVAWYDKHGMVTHDPFEGIRPLYAAPRQWVGLTDEEMEGLYESATYMDKTDCIHLLTLAADKLKEKNDG